MNNFIVTTNIVLPIFLVMAVGFAARRIGLIDDHTVSGCNRLVFRVFLPVSLARSIMRAEGSLGGALPLFAALGTIATFAAGMLIVREAGGIALAADGSELPMDGRKSSIVAGSAGAVYEALRIING